MCRSGSSFKLLITTRSSPFGDRAHSRVDPRFRIPCHEVPIPARRAGKTDDGFTATYNSLRVANASTRLVDAVAALQFDHAVNSLTICGHSLGGARATLLALDVAANTIFKNPTIYTYASPRKGDALFARTYNQVLPNTYRIANRVDMVPKLPLPPL